MRNLIISLICFVIFSTLLSPAVFSAEKIYIAFLWHMHQPIYYPYESLVETNNAGRYSFDLLNEVMNTRTGPYQTWPKDAVEAGSGFAHLGAQISFSGSLIENCNTLWGSASSATWDNAYDYGRGLQTSLGNPRLDLVAFGCIWVSSSTYGINWL